MTDFSISTFISPTPDTINPFVDHLVTTKARHLVETCRLPSRWQRQRSAGYFATCCMLAKSRTTS
ncbi:MAG: hypothetical protein ACK5VN_07950, partial [Phycisphaerae bacterium]